MRIYLAWAAADPVGYEPLDVTKSQDIRALPNGGVPITHPWEVFFADDTPGREWASEIAPAVTTPRTTTHHASHLEAT